MKKFKNQILMVLLALMFILAAVLSGCNRQIIDVTYSFDKAIISLPNGEIVEGKVDSWKDYDDGDQIQVKVNGITYLVHSENIVLISE